MTRWWVYSLVMLCYRFNAAICSPCMFLGVFSCSFAFIKWNACLIGFKSGDWLDHCRTFSFFAIKKNLGLLLMYALCNCPSVLWSRWVFEHLAEFVQVTKPHRLQNSSRCFCYQSRHQYIQGNQFRWQPYTDDPYALAHGHFFLTHLYSFFPLHIILVQVDLYLMCPYEVVPELNCF